MAIERRAVLHIKTMAELVDVRRSRTSAGALLELAMLEMEKQRLKKEMLRAESRGAEIATRMQEIETKQVRLQSFVERPVMDYPSVPSRSSLGAAPALPIFSAPTDGLKRRALAY